MNLNIKILTHQIPQHDSLDYCIEFEKIFQDATHTEPNFHTGTMMILKGAVIQQWYQIVGKHRKWVRSLDPAQAYAFGVDAFETEVN
jgi:hypothetical protein